jgi:hypothetical protein
MRIFLLLLLAASAVLAGEIYQATCDGCGYTEDDLWLGSGLEDPFCAFALYWVADWRQVVSVEFDLSVEFGELIGYDFAPIRHDVAIWDVVREQQAEYDEFRGSWSPPEVIEDALPRGATIYSNRPETHLIPPMLRLDDVWEEGKVFPCPECGERTLVFETVGCWD